LRINRGGNYRPAGAADFRPLSQAVTQGGPAWAGVVTCFSSRDAQLACTLLARWDAAHTDPWLIVTNLPPDAADVVWYGLRTLSRAASKMSSAGAGIGNRPT